MSMQPKVFHETYDGTARVESSAQCTECLSCNEVTMSYVAEHNAGELYTINVCAKCLQESLDKVLAREELVIIKPRYDIDYIEGIHNDLTDAWHTDDEALFNRGVYKLIELIKMLCNITK